MRYNKESETLDKLKYLLLLLLWLTGSELFGENLLEVYELAVTNDPQLKAAASTRDAVLESRPQARARLLPNISLDGSVTHLHRDIRDTEITGTSTGNIGEGVSNLYTISLNLLQPVYRRDLWIQLQQADRQILQAEAEYAAEEQDLILRAAQAYFDILSAQDELEFVKAESAAFARQLDQSQQRFDVGLIAITDVYESQAAFDQSKADLIGAENALANAWEALYEIILEQVESLSTLAAEIPLDKPQPENINSWDETAQIQNLTLMAAIQSTNIARENIEEQRSGHYPTLDIVGAYSIDRNNKTKNSDVNTASIGLQLNLPIYLGGGVSASVRQAVSEYEAAQENLDRQRRAVKRQVKDAYRGVVDRISAVKALKASTISTQSALDATQAGLEVGTRTTVDVLNAQRDVFRARSNYSQVRYQYILNGLTLKQAAGSLSVDDLVQINQWLEQ